MTDSLHDSTSRGYIVPIGGAELPIYAERSEVLALMERLASEDWVPGKPLP